MVAGALKPRGSSVGQSASAGLQGEPGRAGPLQRLCAAAKVFSLAGAATAASSSWAEINAKVRGPVPNLAVKLPKGSNASRVSSKTRRVSIDMGFTCHDRAGVSRARIGDPALGVITCCHIAVSCAVRVGIFARNSAAIAAASGGFYAGG